MQSNSANLKLNSSAQNHCMANSLH